MASSSTRPRARAPRRRTRVIALQMSITLSTFAACRLVDRPPLDDLPSTNGATMRAVLVLHDRDCDGNLASFGVFDRDDVRRALPLVGVVALDRGADTTRIRESLAAYDLAVPILAVGPATRDSLRSAAHDRGMTVLIVRPGRVVVALPPPQSADQFVQFRRSVLTLAATSATPLR